MNKPTILVIRTYIYMYIYIYIYIYMYIYIYICKGTGNYKLIDIKGVPQNPLFDVKKFEEIIDSFQTRNNDVFVSTFVKAGRI
jgi:hypothetical protein